MENRITLKHNVYCLLIKLMKKMILLTRSTIAPFYEDSASFTVAKARFNSKGKESDIAPFMLGKDVIYSSSKRRNMLYKKDHAWTNKNFYRLYIAKENKKKGKRFSPHGNP